MTDDNYPLKPRLIIAALGEQPDKCLTFTNRLIDYALRVGKIKGKTTNPGWFDWQREHHYLTIVNNHYSPLNLNQLGPLFHSVDGLIVLFDPTSLNTTWLQSRLHVAQPAGVRRLIGFVEQTSSQEAALRAELELRQMMQMAEYPGDDLPVIHDRFEVAGDIIATIDREMGYPQFDHEGPFLLPITELICHVAPANPTTNSPREYLHHCRGRISRGRVKVGDVVEVCGSHQTRVQTIVRELSMFGTEVKEAGAGDPVCIVVAERQQGQPLISRGTHLGKVIADIGTVSLHTQFEATIRLLPATESGRRRTIPSGTRPRWSIGAGMLRGTITYLDGVRDGLPGETYRVHGRLDTPYPLQQGQPLSIHIRGQPVGVGSIAELLG